MKQRAPRQGEIGHNLAAAFPDKRTEQGEAVVTAYQAKNTEVGGVISAAYPDLPPRRLFTLKAYAERHNSFLTLAALTNQVFKAKPRESTKGTIPGNGMEEAGAIVRLAGRVLIDEDGYFRWIDSLQKGGR